MSFSENKRTGLSLYRESIYRNGHFTVGYQKLNPDDVIWLENDGILPGNVKTQLKYLKNRRKILPTKKGTASTRKLDVKEVLKMI